MAAITPPISKRTSTIMIMTTGAFDFWAGITGVACVWSADVWPRTGCGAGALGAG